MAFTSIGREFTSLSGSVPYCFRIHGHYIQARRMNQDTERLKQQQNGLKTNQTRIA
jgi:hypothetical protein